VNRPKMVGGYALPENQEIWRQNKAEMEAKYGTNLARSGLIHGPAYEAADVPDHAYEDGYATEVAIATLKELVKQDRPFFLGLGLKKPHLDFIAPQKYWDLYDRDEIPLATHAQPPRNGAAMAIHPSFELRVRHGIPKEGPIGPELARTLRHAYLACVSYADANIGKMIDALDEAGVRDNTIIILWGDHGWHLGDMGAWGKATNYEIATRVPLMIWTPDMPSETRGQKTDGLVELVDMYPTLCDLAGISLPQHLEGHSFQPLLEDPQQPWKRAAFSQFPNPALREWAANPLSRGMRETWFGPLIQEVEQRIIIQQGRNWDRELFEEHLMGYTMRTDRYRLVLWQDTREPSAEPIDVELYDHQNDPAETVNIAEQQPEIVADLIKQFRSGWRATLSSIKK
ncbi:sulfatase, partial [Rhodopirellula sallentina]